MARRTDTLRVAVLWHDTVVSEQVVRAGAVTVGEDLSNTLVLPPVAEIGARYPLFEAGPEGGWLLAPTHAMGGRLHRRGREESLADARARGGDIPVEKGDWGQLDLGPLSLFFRVGEDAEVLPPHALWGTIEAPVLGALLGALSLHLAVLIAAFSFFEDEPTFIDLTQEDRFLQVVAEHVAREEDEVLTQEAVTEDIGKKVEGKESSFGLESERKPSRLQKREGKLVDRIRKAGVVRALALGKRGVLGDVMGGQSKLVDDLNAAMAGGDASPVVGYGLGGMGTRNLGGNGTGGTGFGEIGGMGSVPGGRGGRGTQSRLVTRKKTPPKGPGGTPPVISGDFCRQADIQRVVARHRNGVQACYEKELRAQPELQGKLTLTWRIGLDGRVVKAFVNRNTLGSREVANCVRRAVKRWRFPKPDGGQCQVRFPFVFSSGL